MPPISRQMSRPRWAMGLLASPERAGPVGKAEARIRRVACPGRLVARAARARVVDAASPAASAWRRADRAWAWAEAYARTARAARAGGPASPAVAATPLSACAPPREPGARAGFAPGAATRTCPVARTPPAPACASPRVPCAPAGFAPHAERRARLAAPEACAMVVVATRACAWPRVARAAPRRVCARPVAARDAAAPPRPVAEPPVTTISPARRVCARPVGTPASRAVPRLVTPLVAHLATPAPALWTMRCVSFVERWVTCAARATPAAKGAARPQAFARPSGARPRLTPALRPTLPRGAVAAPAASVGREGRRP